jgi:hypothetical protein
MSEEKRAENAEKQDNIMFYSSEEGKTVYGTFILRISRESYSFSLTELFEHMTLIDLKRLQKRLEYEFKKREEETK